MDNNQKASRSRIGVIALVVGIGSVLLIIAVQFAETEPTATSEVGRYQIVTVNVDPTLIYLLDTKEGRVWEGSTVGKDVNPAIWNMMIRCDSKEIGDKYIRTYEVDRVLASLVTKPDEYIEVLHNAQRQIRDGVIFDFLTPRIKQYPSATQPSGDSG